MSCHSFVAVPISVIFAYLILPSLFRHIQVHISRFLHLHDLINIAHTTPLPKHQRPNLNMLNIALTVLGIAAAAHAQAACDPLTGKPPSKFLQNMTDGFLQRPAQLHPAFRRLPTPSTSPSRPPRQSTGPWQATKRSPTHSVWEPSSRLQSAMMHHTSGLISIFYSARSRLSRKPHLVEVSSPAWS